MNILTMHNQDYEYIRKIGFPVTVCMWLPTARVKKDWPGTCPARPALGYATELARLLARSESSRDVLDLPVASYFQIFIRR